MLWFIPFLFLKKKGNGSWGWIDISSPEREEVEPKPPLTEKEKKVRENTIAFFALMVFATLVLVAIFGDS